MKLGKDISAQFKSLYLVHQNVAGKREQLCGFDQHLLFIPLQGEITVEAPEGKHVLGPGQMLYLPVGWPPG